jgi:hypothetical protein
MNLFKFIHDKLDMNKIINLRSSQYMQPLYVEDIVDPSVSQTKDTPLPLSLLGDFLVLSFTGFYTSLRVKAALTLQDLGICPLRMKIQAGASTLQMFGDYVPMNIIFTPGRVRVNPADPQLITGGYALADADQGPVPNQLFYPYGYIFPFAANDTVTVSVKTDFDVSTGGWKNRWGICFYGIRSRNVGTALHETNKKSFTPKH